jgi:hypothetical protein
MADNRTLIDSEKDLQLGSADRRLQDLGIQFQQLRRRLALMLRRYRRVTCFSLAECSL